MAVFLNVFELMAVLLNVLELMAVFLNVLENVIPTLLCISPKLWPYQLPTIL